MNTLETSMVARNLRLKAWGNALARLCGPLILDQRENHAIDGCIEAVDVGRVKLCSIEASSHRVELPQTWAAANKHPVIKVVVQLQGCSIFAAGDRSLSISAGDCFAYDASRPHSISYPTTTRHLAVVVPKTLAANYGLRLTDAASQCFSADQGLGHITRELVENTLASAGRMDADYGEEIADLILRSLRLSLLERKSCSLLSSGRQLLYQAQEYVGKHLSNPCLDVEQIAAALGCSKRYLHMVFADSGLSVERYIWSARLERCRHEIAEGTSKSLTELAFAWGFSSSSHFSRRFKQRYGFAPSDLVRGGHAENH